jgi:hypothetical protein
MLPRICLNHLKKDEMFLMSKHSDKMFCDLKHNIGVLVDGGPRARVEGGPDRMGVAEAGGPRAGWEGGPDGTRVVAVGGSRAGAEVEGGPDGTGVVAVGGRGRGWGRRWREDQMGWEWWRWQYSDSHEHHASNWHP